MNIGRLDRRIVIESSAMAKQPNGEEIPTWNQLDTVWATVKYGGDTGRRESEEQGKETTVTPVEFTIRYRNDVSTAMRVYYRTEYFDIMRINEVGRNEGLKLVTEKRF